jgi:serine/threonine protein kinase
MCGKTINQPLNFQKSSRLENLSESCKEFMLKLTTKDPKQRPSSEDAWEDSWLSQGCGLRPIAAPGPERFRSNATVTTAAESEREAPSFESAGCGLRPIVAPGPERFRSNATVTTAAESESQLESYDMMVPCREKTKSFEAIPRLGEEAIAFSGKLRDMIPRSMITPERIITPERTLTMLTEKDRESNAMLSETREAWLEGSTCASKPTSTTRHGIPYSTATSAREKQQILDLESPRNTAENDLFEPFVPTRPAGTKNIKNNLKWLVARRGLKAQRS